MPAVCACPCRALPSRAVGRALAAALVGLVVLLAGCAQQRYVRVRERPHPLLPPSWNLAARKELRPTPRTVQLLRRYDLVGLHERSPEAALARLQKEIESEPTLEKICSYAELSYLHGKRLEQRGKPKDALDAYGAAVAYAYWYLLDPALDPVRNPYDPQFRRACDLYNDALAGAMRLVIRQNRLRPGETQVIQTGQKQLQVQVVLRGPWRPEEIDRLEFVRDYEVEGGLTNHYHTYGLGVPLIAVRAKLPEVTQADRYYPPGLSFPITAFLRVERQTPQQAASGVYRCTLELYDPLYSSDIAVANRLVPLETDLTTPLAYFLDNPAFREKDLATLGLLNPNAQGIKGLYMVEPFDPQRIPVVMVHGLWSSPLTWMEMFNDLRGDPIIRRRFQFWFYLYPTGQPFWISAAQLRRDLAQARQVLDPQHQEPALDHMVLIGHSMGGLVSRMQTIDSRDDLWKLVSTQPFKQIKTDDEIRQRLAETFFFRPNPSIRRVITIGTPHRGSSFSNQTTQWLLGKLIHLPSMLVNSQQKIFRDNKDALPPNTLLKIETSIDSLSPNCPVFPVLLASHRLPTVKYHNIIGVIPNKWWWTSLVKDSDGVVSRDSARVDDVVSELIVPADHTTVHSHPAAVLEVRRILQEHLAELRGWSRVRFAETPQAAPHTVELR